MRSVITALPVRLPNCPGVTDRVLRVEVSQIARRGANGVDPTCPQRLLVACPQGSNFSEPKPSPAVENYPNTILTPFALTVFVRVVDLENRNETFTCVPFIPPYRFMGENHGLPYFPSLCYEVEGNV